MIIVFILCRRFVHTNLAQYQITDSIVYQSTFVKVDQSIGQEVRVTIVKESQI